jgi:hypothetical protein
MVYLLNKRTGLFHKRNNSHQSGFSVFNKICRSMKPNSNLQKDFVTVRLCRDRWKHLHLRRTFVVNSFAEIVSLQKQGLRLANAGRVSVRLLSLASSDQ